jgi:hypothetical protein
MIPWARERSCSHEKHFTRPAAVVSKLEPSIHGAGVASFVPDRASPFWFDHSDQHLADCFDDGSPFEIAPVRDCLTTSLRLFAGNFLVKRRVDIFGVAFVGRFENGLTRLLIDPLVPLKGTTARDKNYCQQSKHNGNPIHGAEFERPGF